MTDFLGGQDANIDNIFATDPQPVNDAQSATSHHDSTSGGYKNDTFKTWWRNGAMMAIKLIVNEDPTRNKIMFNFMLGDPNNRNADKKSYRSDTKTAFTLDFDEAFKLNEQLNYMWYNVKQNKMGSDITLTHSYNNEVKVLHISQAKDKPRTIFISLKKGNDRYSISMDHLDFKLFMFSLKLLMYEMVTGTKVGFRFDWI